LRLALTFATLVATAAAAHAAGDGDGAFERGVERFSAEDFAAAIAPLRAALAASPSDRDAELLLGISYFRTGDDASARPLLAEVSRADDADDAATARVFLGLLADRDGDNDLARSYYDAVARSSTELAATGRALAARGAPDRWSLVAVLRPEVDSNVALQPGAAIAMPGAQAADADLFALAGATVRPLDAVPITLDDTLSYRKQGRLTSYDLLANSLGATWDHAGDALRASAAYHFESSTLGGARYQLGHVGELAGRYALTDGWGAAARYTIAARDYAPDAYAGYSGIYHRGELGLDWADRARAVELSVGYVIARELTDDASLAATGQGARAAVRVVAWKGAELRADIEGQARVFDDASMGRRDVVVRGGAAFYVDLSSAWGVVVGATALRNASNVADFDFTKLTAYAGLVAALGP
jgi:hypothetical protein